MSSNASYFLEDRSQPLVNQNPASLNDRLATKYVDVPVDDQSCQAQMTRRVANFVGSILTPKQVLAILRVLKAVTLCFIVLTIIANILYLFTVKLFASKEVQAAAGGNRDTLIRLYGLVLSFIALAIEIDYVKVVRRYSGLKAFIPRGLLYLFIAIITASRPHRSEPVNNNYNQYQYQQQNDDAAGDDAAGDDAAQDDQYYYQQAAASQPVDVTDEIPSSAVAFQMVAAYVLYVSNHWYINQT